MIPGKENVKYKSPETNVAPVAARLVCHSEERKEGKVGKRSERYQGHVMQGFVSPGKDSEWVSTG